MEATRRYAIYGARAVVAGVPDLDLGDVRANIVDTVANVMHLCNRMGIDFDGVYTDACMHYYDELKGA